LELTLLSDDGNLIPDSRGNTSISTKSSTGLIDPALHDIAVNKTVSSQPTASTFSPQTQVIKAGLPIFPDFLLPGTFDDHLKKYKAVVAEGIASRNFTPLMPLHIARRLIENSFAEIMAEHHLITLSHFLTHLDAQYAATSFVPGDDSARWAVVNAILALSVRSKTAPGSESLTNITHGFYQNATKVLPELILRDPCLLSIQGLLAMAMFAQCNADVPAFVMLASSATRQLELLSLSWSSTGRLIRMEETEQYEQVCRTANVFEKIIREFLGSESPLCEGQDRFGELQRQVENQGDAVGFLSDMRG
jgi:hypothetical protein